jgi:DNA-binding transcriptional regulator YdaS (Cro superfamily)
MDKEFKEKVDKRLKLMGIKKSYLAEKMSVSPPELSQIFSGYRKMKPEEETKLRLTLNI